MNASATILTDNALVTIAQGGTNSSTSLTNGKLMVSSGGKIVEGTSSSVPSFTSISLSATSNQLVLGTANTITLTASVPGSSRTYALEDAGANAKFAITSATPVNDRLPKWNGTIGNLANSGISDNGSVISTSEVLSINANSGSGNDGLSVSNSNSAGSALSAISTGTGDGVYGVKGSVSATAASSSNELIGIWGLASSTNAASVKTIGVRAEGNATSTGASTNTALSILEGSINIGRQGTTATNNGGTDLVNATSEDDATAADKGPSGVVDLSAISEPGNNSGNSATLVVKNIYATSTSIILLNILNTDGTGFVATKEMATASIEARGAGTFTIRVFRYNFGNSNGGNWTPRIGYLIINAAK